MNNIRFAVAFCLALVLLAGAGSDCRASKADELLQQAQDKILAAERAKDTADKNEGYTDALKILGKIESDSKFVGTPQGAEAVYKIGLVNVALAEATKDPKKKHGYLYAAYEALKRGLNIYDKPRETLEQNLTGEEARRVLEIVADAKALKQTAADTLDRLNSSDIKYKVIDFLVRITGKIPSFSYWFAIILITFLVKLALTPLTHMQFKSMKEMQKVAPLVKEIQAKYKGDQKTIGEKTMALYKEHGVNPFASCLPLLVQMPILILLFYTIKSYEFQFAKGTFFWIGSGLSHLASFKVMFNPGQLVWVTARNLSEPDLILVVLYVISMYISTKLSSVDPTQAEQQKMMAVVMPLMFAFLFAGFPSAFLLYWLVFNILQTVQQYYILHGGKQEVLVAATAPNPGPEPESEEPKSNDAPNRKRRKRK